jgi:outer membrane protein with beta-barrel domain
MTRLMVSLVIFGMLLVAQTAVAQPVTAGAIGGWAGATVTVENFPPEVDPQPGSGGAFGGFVEFRPDGVVSVRTEVLYMARRYELGNDAGFPVTGGTNSIDVPILLCLRTAHAPKVKGVLYGGPHFTFLTNSWQDYRDVRTEFDDQLRNDAGVTVGGGIEVPMRKGDFLLEGRGMFGLRNIWLPVGQSIKVRTFGIFAGYRF